MLPLRDTVPARRLPAVMWALGFINAAIFLPGVQITSAELQMTDGRWTHDHPLTAEEAKHLGLPVRTGLPEEIYDLMRLYPQPAQRRPSVEYVPAHYHAAPNDGISPRP